MMTPTYHNNNIVEQYWMHTCVTELYRCIKHGYAPAFDMESIVYTQEYDKLSKPCIY